MGQKYINIPGTPIKDNQTGLEADVIAVGGYSALVTTGTVTGEITTTPPSDRRFKRFTVDNTSQPLVFAGFEIKGISIKADQVNDGRVRIGEIDLITSDNYTVLEPGEVYSAEINGTLNPIYVTFDPGTSSAVVYVAALGDPVA